MSYENVSTLFGLVAVGREGCGRLACFCLCECTDSCRRTKNVVAWTMKRGSVQMEKRGAEPQKKQTDYGDCEKMRSCVDGQTKTRLIDSEGSGKKRKHGGVLRKRGGAETKRVGGGQKRRPAEEQPKRRLGEGLRRMRVDRLSCRHGVAPKKKGLGAKKSKSKSQSKPLPLSHRNKKRTVVDCMLLVRAAASLLKFMSCCRRRSLQSST